MAGPDLSVVVPSVNGLEDLAGCLESLVAESRREAIEILVPDRCGDTVRSVVARQFPQVRILAAAPRTTIPDLRAMAFDAARADTVAVIEDHVLVPPGWATLIIEARRQGADVVGGTLYNAAAERMVDWAAYLCEYSHMLADRPPGPATWLTGNNVAYRRTLLERYRPAVAAGRWEDYLHDRMREDGIVLIYRPDIRVAHKKHYTVGEYLDQRFLYSRAHAGARVAGRPFWRRMTMALGAGALPAVLLARIAGRVWRAQSCRAEFVRALPLLVLFVSSWALGEATGFVAGPGDALSRVR